MFGGLDLLVNEIGKMLWTRQALYRATGEELLGRPRLGISEQQRTVFKGQTLFRNQCATCHTIGKGDWLGPDLLGVTARRERNWLARFIAFPDEMRARQDPIAIELAAQYPSVPMPNVGLTREQVADLLDYLEAQKSPAVKEQHRAD